jgi:hypothetical protein
LADRLACLCPRTEVDAELQTERRGEALLVVDLLDRADAALDSGLSNALIESTNTKIRLIALMAFGFHGPEPLITLAMLAHGGYPPALPGR